MCSRKDSVTWVTQLPVFPEPSVQGWYSSPLKVHILILRSCDYVTLCNKRGFEDVIKLSILRWSDYSRLPGGALCNHKGLYKRDVGGLYSKNVIYLEKQVAVWEFWRYSTAGFEDGGREYIGQGVQVASWIPVSSASLMLELSPLTLCWKKKNETSAYPMEYASEKSPEWQRENPTGFCQKAKKQEDLPQASILRSIKGLAQTDLV